MRSRYDAILIGSNTVKADDPFLTVRTVKGRNPRRIILDSRLSTSLESKVYKNSGSDSITIFCSEQADKSVVNAFIRKGIKIVQIPVEREGILDLNEVLNNLYEMKINSILVEGGQAVFSAFIRAGLADELIIIQSSSLL